MKDCEVRIKLQVLNKIDSSVHNLWMCLNYLQKPTIAHIVEHVRKSVIPYYKAQQNPIEGYSFNPSDFEESVCTINLFLDEYWLPPYENSKIIKDNDCIKIEVELIDENQPSENWLAAKLSSLEAKIQNKNQPQVPVADEQPKPVETKKSTRNARKAVASNYQDESDHLSEEQVIDDYYTSIQSTKKVERPVIAEKKEKKAKIDHTQSKSQTTVAQPKTTQSQKEQTRFASNVDIEKIASSVNAAGKSKWKNGAAPAPAPNGPKHIIFSSSDSTSDSSSDSSSSESDDETFVNSNQQQQNTNKQSTKQKKQTNKTETKQQQPQAKPQTVAPKQAVKKVEETTAEKQEQQEQQQQQQTNGNKGKNGRRGQNNFYEKTKEEQLQTESSERVFVIKNAKSMQEFKKVFNEAKLNAPTAENLFKDQNEKDLYEQQKQEAKQHLQNLLNSMEQRSQSQSTSGSSTMTSSESSMSFSGNEQKQTATQKRNRRRYRKSRSPSYKYDYESMEALDGKPRVNDRIAFQILEISSSFTPEVSQYKNGVVIEVDAQTNEVTLKLDQSYNSVLKKPSKFSVILNDDEHSGDGSSDQSRLEESLREQEEDNILKVDWRNLMNVKLHPKETQGGDLKNEQNILQEINTNQMVC